MARASPDRLAVCEDPSALDPDRKWEIVDGRIVEKADPTGEHSHSQARVIVHVGGPFDRRGGHGGPGGWWILSEVTIEVESHEVYRPDVAGWRRDRVPDRPSGHPVRVLPDWVCEVLSPSTAKRDLGPKLRSWHRHRLVHYWIIDPIGEILTVLRWSPDGYVVVITAGPDDRVRPEPFEAVELQVGTLFGADADEDAGPSMVHEPGSAAR